MQKTRELMARGYSKVGAIAGGALLASPAFAAGEFDAFIDAVDLTGVATKVIAAGLLIVAIAIAFKGPDLAKRLVRKV